MKFGERELLWKTSNPRVPDQYGTISQISHQEPAPEVTRRSTVEQTEAS
jgi:hypothetical protein